MSIGNEIKGKASIILLYGTSTAGKTTICKELEKLDAKQTEEQKLHWVIDGTDLACERASEEIDNYCTNKIKEKAESRPLLENVQQAFTNREIGMTIFSGKIFFDGQELILRGASEADFERKLDNFYKNMPLEKREFVSKKAIKVLQLLANEHKDMFDNYHGPEELHIKMFQDAIERSKKFFLS